MTQKPARIPNSRFLLVRSAVSCGCVALGLPGCGDGTIEPRQPIVRDSSGVMIVENRSGAPEHPGWHLGETPSLEIGRAGQEGPDLFGSIQQVARLDGGEVAVADGWAREVRVFDQDGTHLHTFGGPGEGPGEFSSLWRVAALQGDSVAAVDNLGGRVSVFGPDGGFARSFGLPRVEGGGPPNFIDVLGDGTLVLSTPTAPPSQDGRARSTIRIYTVDRTGAVVRELGERFDRELGANGLALGFGGQAVVAVGDSLIWAAHTSRFSLEGVAPDGSLRRIIRMDRSPRPVTEREVSDARAAAEESLVRQGASGTVMERIRETEFAAAHPVLGPVLVDRSGYLWVADPGTPTFGAPPAGAAPQGWDVFTPEGRWLARLRMPPGFRLNEVGEDFVLGVHTDPVGVERVRLYSLVRGAT